MIASTRQRLRQAFHASYQQLSPLFWERTRARLDAEQLSAEFGVIAIPAEPLNTSAAVEQQVPAG